MNVIDLKAFSSEPIFALCYGDSGSGKTHLAGTLGELGSVLVIDIDKGHKTLQYAADLAKARENITVVSFDAFGDLTRAAEAVEKNDPEFWNKTFKVDSIQKPFDWVVWDSWSQLQWNMQQELRSKQSDLTVRGINFRKAMQIQHWGMLTDLNKLALDNLKSCKKINQLFLMQQVLIKNELTGEIHGGPAIHGKLVDEVPGWFDVVVRTYTSMTGKYMATTKPMGKWVAKTRLQEGKEYQNPKASDIF